MKIKLKDALAGGAADDLAPEDFSAEALAEGAEHELEHTDDPSIAQEIAMDHLAEDEDYYQKLEQVEMESESSCRTYGCGYSRTDGILACSCQGRCPSCAPYFAAARKQTKALIAVDLHGTIADKNEQHSGEYDPANYDLQPGAVEALKELKDDGHQVAIWTCWDTAEAKKWLDEHGVPYDFVNEEAPDHGSPKIDADAYVDDKGIRHNGDWNRTMAKLVSSGALDKSLPIRVVSKMAPEGPYRSKWADKPSYIVEDIRQGKPVVVIVSQGQQPSQGTPVPNIREARQWLRDNGYEKKSIDKSWLGWANAVAGILNYSSGSELLAAAGVGILAYDLLYSLYRRGVDARTAAMKLRHEGVKSKALMPLDEFAALVNSTAKQVSPWASGTDKRFICDVWQRMPSSMSHTEFVKMLLQCHAKGTVTLSRADLVEAMDPKRVAASTVMHPSGVAEFQFIRPKSVKAVTEIDCPQCHGNGKIQVADDKAADGESEFAVEKPIPMYANGYASLKVKRWSVQKAGAWLATQWKALEAVYGSKDGLAKALEIAKDYPMPEEISEVVEEAKVTRAAGTILPEGLVHSGIPDGDTY